MNPSPNDRQVAGDHYAAPYQHWDLVWDLRLNYFEGQITKYISRARLKNGRQDWEKALHFLEKYISLDPVHNVAAEARRTVWGLSKVTAFLAGQNHLVQWERDVIAVLCLWRGINELKMTRDAMRVYLRTEM